MKRVAQLDKLGCWIACVAMASGKPYREVRGRASSVTYASSKKIKDCLKMHGVKAAQRFRPLRSKSYRTLQCVAVLKVNLRADGNWHWVMWDGEKILDPERGTPGRYKAISYLQVSSRTADRGSK